MGTVRVLLARRIIICLAMGALVNGAVAWLCAYAACGAREIGPINLGANAHWLTQSSDLICDAPTRRTTTKAFGYEVIEDYARQDGIHCYQWTGVAGVPFGSLEWSCSMSMSSLVRRPPNSWHSGLELAPREAEMLRLLCLRRLPLHPSLWGSLGNVLWWTGSIYIVATVVAMFKRRRAVRAHRCTGCGYPMGPSERCSECGHVAASTKSVILTHG